MTLSIRTRLTALITLVYSCVFLVLLLILGYAVFQGLRDENDKWLKTETKIIVNLFHAEFLDLLSANGQNNQELANEFREELNEIHGNRREFALFVLETELGCQMYSDGNIARMHEFTSNTSLKPNDGYTNMRLEGRDYRVLLTTFKWGKVVVGVENHAFREVAGEFRKLSIITIPVTFILVLIGGNFLARRVMRPIVSTAKAAESITLTNLNQRLPDYAGKDEFGVLVATLNGMITRLEEGVSRVKHFTQDAAHELRTPVTIMRGELELAHENNLATGELRTALQKTIDQTISMSKILDNLMLLARSDTGNYPIQRSDFDFDVMLADVIEDVSTMVENRPIKIKTGHIDKVPFNGDRQLLQMALLNLCDNALKNTEIGYICFDLQKLENQIRFALTDTGKGIEAEHLPHIFNRFYRADKSQSSSESGSGLGLAICKWIVTAHAGQITIDSTVGAGTTVVLTLPVKPLPSEFQLVDKSGSCKAPRFSLVREQ